jgi:hypothetical protein
VILFRSYVLYFLRDKNGHLGLIQIQKTTKLSLKD